ncbi:uncharacterized protein LOC107484645 [Arachis duranensis]|uniref:Uncharacterized protein LOC107484645 n=1 Tax=Arachis duranensis TaxID=130453 RepID=A0A6P4D7Q8_ARADU|nr:uncharacterized protein LOC107484645 [Arachis duranensis]
MFLGKGTPEQTSLNASKHQAGHGKQVVDPRDGDRTNDHLVRKPSSKNPLMDSPIFRYLEHVETPPNEKEEQATRREAPKYVIIQGQLYKRGIHQPLLKCLHPDQTDYDLSEVHEGCCSHHIRGRSLARKIIKAGYYWPTMMSDAQEFVRKCKKYQ